VAVRAAPRDHTDPDLWMTRAPVDN